MTVVGDAVMHVSAPVVIERGSIGAEDRRLVGALLMCSSHSCIDQVAERRVLHGHAWTPVSQLIDHLLLAGCSSSSDLAATMGCGMYDLWRIFGIGAGSSKLSITSEHPKHLQGLEQLSKSPERSCRAA